MNIDIKEVKDGNIKEYAVLKFDSRLRTFVNYVIKNNPTITFHNIDTANPIIEIDNNKFPIRILKKESSQLIFIEHLNKSILHEYSLKEIKASEKNFDMKCNHCNQIDIAKPIYASESTLNYYLCGSCFHKTRKLYDYAVTVQTEILVGVD